jgi:redox-sensitive bicupin YhaK (pirin superfamily)
MTAANGIIHSEMPEQEDNLLHGFQLWINLPANEKMKPSHSIGESDKALKAGQLEQLIDGKEICVQTKNQPARFLLLAAMPLKEPVVLSSQGRL